MNLTIDHQNPQIIQDQTDSYTKGRMFEKYIIGLFNQQHFDLKEWRKSGTYDTLPFNHSLPDMEYVFTGKKHYRFAVECKWRRNFYNGKITWATRSQCCIYEEFERRTRIPVFIAIGIGGEPSNPEKLFVTPLQQIATNTQVYESELIPFKRKSTRRFFYDTVQIKLF